MEIEITSFQNPKIKTITSLKNKNKRDKLGLFLIEGYREILRAEENHVEFSSFYYSPEFFLKENEEELMNRIRKKKVPFYKVKKEIFSKLSYRDRPDGLLAVAKIHRRRLSDLQAFLQTKSSPFLVVAESIEKPGNLGTILRSCDAAGVDGMVLVDHCTDLFNPNVVRASVGTLFSENVFEASTDELLSFLKKNSIRIAAATPHAERIFTKTDLTGPIAIVVGTEQYGLSERWMKECDIQVKIPMLGSADSLNVSAAATLLIYEVLRQRSSF